MIGKNSTKRYREGFKTHLSMENFTDVDYAHAKRVCQDFERKKLDEHHDS